MPTVYPLSEYLTLCCIATQYLCLPAQTMSSVSATTSLSKTRSPWLKPKSNVLRSRLTISLTLALLESSQAFMVAVRRILVQSVRDASTLNTRCGALSVRVRPLGWTAFPVRSASLVTVPTLPRLSARGAQQEHTRLEMESAERTALHRPQCRTIKRNAWRRPDAQLDMNARWLVGVKQMKTARSVMLEK